MEATIVFFADDMQLDLQITMAMEMACDILPKHLYPGAATGLPICLRAVVATASVIKKLNKRTTKTS